MLFIGFVSHLLGMNFLEPTFKFIPNSWVVLKQVFFVLTIFFSVIYKNLKEIFRWISPNRGNPNFCGVCLASIYVYDIIRGGAVNRTINGPETLVQVRILSQKIGKYVYSYLELFVVTGISTIFKIKCFSSRLIFSLCCRVK